MPDFKLPDLGEGITEAEVDKWLVAEGDTIAEDDPLVEVITDKATAEIPSPYAGVVTKIHVPAGDVVAVGTVLVSIGEAPPAGATDEAATPEAVDPEAPGEPVEPPAETAELQPSAPTGPPQSSLVAGADLVSEGDSERFEARGDEAVDPAAPDTGPPEEPGPAAETEGEAKATPPIRRLARELGVEIGAIPGTGPGGRITREDVEKAGRVATGLRTLTTGPSAQATHLGGTVAPPGAARRPTLPADLPAADAAEVTAPAAPEEGPPPPPEVPEPILVEPEPAPPEPEPAAAEPEPAPPVNAEAATEPVAPAPEVPRPAPTSEPTAPAGLIPPGGLREPLRGIRRVIAERMAHAHQVVPPVTHVEECDVTALEGARKLANEADPDGPKVTLLTYAVKAAAQSLKEHPALNASLDDAAGEIVYHDRCDIGIAVDTAGGLVVPAIRGADRLSLTEIAAEIERLAAAARDRSLKVEELQGSTFTVTSPGPFGGLLATPIVFHPQSAILGVHRATERPAVHNGQIAIRLMVNLSITFDHRILDGIAAARFLLDVVGLLQNPASLSAAE